MDTDRLQEVVKKFATVWFPQDGSHVKYWFRARDKKYAQTITDLCDAFLDVTEETSSANPVDFSLNLLRTNWSANELLTLAVMLDQMPRNALAVNYGRYQGKDVHDVKSAVDDTFSVAFSRTLLANCDIPPLVDERLLCFFSLVFRHSNDFASARRVLDLTRLNDGTLPPLAEKFWTETARREQSLLNPPGYH